MGEQKIGGKIYSIKPLPSILTRLPYDFMNMAPLLREFLALLLGGC
jgi:hypothetical protein